MSATTANLPSTHLESTKTLVKLLLSQIVDHRYSAESVSSHFGNQLKIILDNGKKLSNQGGAAQEALEQVDMGPEAERIFKAVATTYNYSKALKNMSMWLMKLSQESYLFFNDDFIVNLSKCAHQLKNNKLV